MDAPPGAEKDSSRFKERRGYSGRPGQPQLAGMACQNRLLKAFTAASGPSGYSQTPAETAMKSAPASISAGAFWTVMPPMATDGTTIISDHQRSSSISASVLGSLVRV